MCARGGGRGGVSLCVPLCVRVTFVVRVCVCVCERGGGEVGVSLCVPLCVRVTCECVCFDFFFVCREHCGLRHTSGGVWSTGVYAPLRY